MAQNVTFLLGAGASFHAIPVVGQLNYRLEEFAATLESTGIFRDILPGAPPKSYVVEDEDFKEHRESCDLLASKIRKLVCDISGYLTIDTYAKKLYLQEDYDALDGLKLMLSLYFTIEQLTEKQDEEKHKKGSRIDSRYLSLFASILDKKNSQIAIPENIKFITWNYDYQLELALNVFEDKNLIRNDDNHGFNAFINLQQYQITEQTLDIVHLNGIAGVYWNRKMRKGYSQLYGGTNATDYKSVLIKTLDIFKKLDQKTASLSETFTFAWEKNQIAQNSFQVARNIMKETDVLIVIGYSFPFFNREIDKQLINSFIEADKEGKMYIQNPIDTTSFIKKQFNIQDQLDIEYIQNTEQFFLTILTLAMSELTLSEHLTTAFYYWEHKARGWYFFDIPVQLEPPFQSFSYANHLDFQAEDTGKVRSLPNMVLDGVKGLFKSNKPTAYQPSLEEYYSYEANPYTPSQKIFEIRVVLPEQKDIPAEIMHQLLLMLSTTREPLSFEIIGTEDEITLQIVCREFDYQVVYGNFKTFLPSAIISPTEKPFHTLFKNDLVTGIVDSGLSEEFMRPIKMDHKLNPDPLTGIYASLEHLGHEELGIVQILFQGTKSPWSKSIMSSVTDFDGKPFFKDAPETTKLAQLKVANPLFGVVIRVAAQAHSEYRVETIIYGLLGSLRSLNNPNSNELIPLSNEGLPLHFHVQDLLLRQSHRMGMILNSKELLGLVHLPASHIQSRKLRGAIKKTKALHPQHNGYEYVLGVNSHFGQSQSISLTTEERLRHVHLIGATGSGKSNLMKNLIVQDIQNGQGICVLDPHGDLVEDVLVRVPEERIKDLILIDPSDMEYPIGLNLLSAKSEIEKIVLESDLVSVFRRQSTSWGDQMTSVLSNAINAFLESNKGGSLLDLRTFLVDKNFRNEFLKTVEDESVIQFWQKEFPLLRSNSIASILTRLDTFLRPKVIRHMMMQTKGLDFDEAMNSGKILLIKLSQGLIGEANSHLLGTLFIAKLNQASLSRQQIEASKRKPFYLYIDEFQNFITDSLTSILSGARKYGLGLVLAHQDMEQVMAKDREVANSVLSNPYTRICFRCGDNDARKLEQSFSFFEAADIQNLQVGEAIVRIGQRDNDGNIATELLSPVDELMALHTKGIIVESSRAKYAEHISNLKKKKANLAQEEELEEPIEEEIEEKPVDETIKTEHTLKPTESKPIEQTTTHLELAKDKFIKNFEEQKEQRQHQLLQTFVKKIAEERGFKATVEEPTPDGRRVDVGLSANNLKIACEISVTNTVDYEVQNIQKCFNADYKHVFMISDNPKHLRMIREAAIQSIDKEFLSNLIFITSQNLIDEIDRIIAQSEKKPQITQKIAGYRIHVKTNPKGDILKVKDSIKDTIRKSLQNRKDGDE